MKIIKLNAIDSTNSYLIHLAKKEELEDRTVVVAERQNNGRGQLGAIWQSKPLQSLTFSIYKRFDNLPVSNLPSIAFAVSIGVQRALKNVLVSQITIKWPNDIMSYSKKVAGVLIENQLKQNNIISSVIGIGLNVNEEGFKNLPQATSLLLSTGKKHNLDEILQMVSESIINQLERIAQKDHLNLKKEYEALLFRKEIISVFENNQGIRFNGKIKGVSDAGELLIENDQEIISSYKLKEIKYLFS